MNDETSRVYLDYAATAPMRESAIAAYAEAARRYPANPNSLHSAGREAYSALESARREVARLLNARLPLEVVFTSGGTEGDILSLTGITCALPERKRGIVVSTIEHEAVLKTAARLGAEGWDIRYIDPDRGGFVQPDALDAMLDESVGLVSIQLANNEVGTIQPVRELAEVAHRHGALMHTDAVQAAGKIPVDLRGLDVDAASFSAHKFGGPRGVGILYLKSRTPFSTLMTGGGQEEGRRSGTQNVAGIVSTVAALNESIELLASESVRQRGLIHRLLAAVDGIEGIEPIVDPRDGRGGVGGGACRYLPNLAALATDRLESETVVLKLDEAGFEISGGSACSSKRLEPGHVVKVLGIPERLAFGQLRITVGQLTSVHDIDSLIGELRRIIVDDGGGRR